MQSTTYYIKSVKDTSFDPDQFGNKFYSIEVEGVQGNLLWKTKNRPNNGTSVYGHIEPSKSGKSKLFKRDQKPEDYVEPSKPTYSEELLSSQPLPQAAPTSRVDVSQPTNAQIMDAIRKTYLLVKENNDLLKGVEDKPLTQDKFNKDVLLSSDEEDHIDGEGVVDLSEIPF